MAHSSVDLFVGMFRSSVTTLVRREGGDLTARQTAIVLAVYMEDTPQTVRGLAQLLNISKPAVSRAACGLICSVNNAI